MFLTLKMLKRDVDAKEQEKNFAEGAERDSIREYSESLNRLIMDIEYFYNKYILKSKAEYIEKTSSQLDKMTPEQ